MTIFIKILSALLTLIGLSFLSVYAVSEYRLSNVSYDPPFTAQVPTDKAAIEKGRYIARTRGCFGCHGQQLEGKNFDEQWDWPDRAIAPNLAQYARKHNPETIEAAVRQGITAEGKGVVSMPSFNFARLSDTDMAALIAFLKDAPVVENSLPEPVLGWQARWDIAVGNELSYAVWADAVPELVIDEEVNPIRARGEYLAMTMCNECHGLDLRGYSFAGYITPDLAMVAGIEKAEFSRIIRTGRGIGGRHLGLMTLVAPDRFPTLTEGDVDALYLHLTQLHTEPVNEAFWRQ